MSTPFLPFMSEEAARDSASSDNDADEERDDEGEEVIGRELEVCERLGV